MKKLLTVVFFSALVLASCGRRTAVQHDVVDPRHGKELWLGVGAMTGVGGVAANGVARGHYFEDGTSIHRIGVNIQPLPDVRFVAWLIGPAGTEPVRLGELSSPTRDVRFSLTVTTQKDLRSYQRVVVTAGEDQKSVQAEGKLVVRRK